MKPVALSLEQTPPLSVPLRFFVTAPLFAMAAAAVMLWYGPEILASRWMPPLLAVTHLVTLGFISMTMIGAVHQLLPVLMASPIPLPRVTSSVIHFLLTTGTVLFGMGMVSGTAGLLRGAMMALGTGLAIFIMVAAYCLVEARSRHATVYSMALAMAALAVTAAMGLLLLGAYALPSLQIPRYLTDLHLIWGMLGWVGLLVSGVAYQVVPMFQLTLNYPAAMMRWLAGVLFMALTGWSVSPLLPPSSAGLLRPVAGAVVAGGYWMFASTTLRLQQRRHRRLPDVSVEFWRMALISLQLAMLLWIARPFFGSSRQEILLGMLLIVGFAMSVISGMLYKIVPFLVWLHLNNRMQEQGRWGEKIPNMKEIISPLRIRWQFRLQLASLLLLLASVIWPQPLLRPAALLFFAAFFLLWWNLLEGVRIYLRSVRQKETNVI